MKAVDALKRFFKPETSDAQAKSSNLLDAFIQEALKKNTHLWDKKPADFEMGQAILEASPKEQISIIKMIVSRSFQGGDWQIKRLTDNLLSQLIKRNLPYEEDDIRLILDELSQAENFYTLPAQGLLRALAKPLDNEALRERCKPLLIKLKKKSEFWYDSAETRKFFRLLDTILVEEKSQLQLYEDEWAEQARPALESLEPELKDRWLELLSYCASASGSAPSKTWLSKAKPLIENLSEARFRQLATSYLSFFNKTSGKAPERRPDNWMNFQSRGALLDDRNTDLLKGLAWLSSLSHDANLTSSLTDSVIQGYRKIPGHGPRAAKVASACLYALSQIPSMDAVAGLERARLSVKQASHQKGLAKALDTAAKRLGMSRADLEEMSIPDFGLNESHKTLDFSEALAKLEVDGSSVKLNWFAGGKARKSVPASVKRDFAEELKALKKEQADIAKMLSAQKDRLERLPLMQRAWNYQTWCERYLNHPLLASMSRKLIWQFEESGNISDGFYLEGHMLDATGKTLDWLSPKTTVRPWHPVYYDASEVLAWREFLESREIMQPFKQAHREIYLLTSAEESTRVYSNRYAAHILKQHQFNALCSARGWKNQLRLMVDDTYPPAYLELPQWNLRAEFWIEGIGQNYGEDTNETGTYLYLSTDQVRFYPLDASPNYAHAGGGGYTSGYDWRTKQARHNEPLALENIAQVVFSEIMRDVDMFIGVASVANDPTWFDGGPDGRHLNYWQTWSFGELSTSAKSRKELLEKLIPRLKIASRCEVSQRFLNVRGDLRSYKIHLGSGNILMEPNDQYLCIVPGRGSAEIGKDKVFLPFEGDRVLSIILSKAFMLADDTKITDPTITVQLKP